jgi:hypothetical protein
LRRAEWGEHIDPREEDPMAVEREERRPYTFTLETSLVERARQEVGESDVVRSIETALAAAIDYRSWVREVREGRRDILG